MRAERGERLTISPEELSEARIYSGFDAVRNGLVDGIGNDTEAMKAVADMAGIANYDLVDINTEVARIFSQKLRRALEPLQAGAEGTGASATANAMRPFLEFQPAEPAVEVSQGEVPSILPNPALPRFYFQYAPPDE